MKEGVRMSKRISKYRGVHWNTPTNSWRARIYKDGKHVNLGLFKREDMAFAAYCKQFKLLHGYSYRHIEPIFDYNKGTARIPLSAKRSTTMHGKFWAIIDIVDFEKVNKYCWGFSKGYVTAFVNKRVTSLHRFIMEHPHSMIDHINGNKLDNRKCNLRCVTSSQNQMNSAKQVNTVSIYKGVTWNKKSRKWQAQICKNRQKRCIGFYTKEIEAAKAYDAFAKAMFGEFAYVNFPGKHIPISTISVSSRRKPKTSKYIGVSASSRGNKWEVNIHGNKKQIYIGTFKKEINAAQAYNFAAEKYHGQFAKYNIHTL